MKKDEYKITVTVERGGGTATVSYFVAREKIMAPGYPPGIRAVVELFEQSIVVEGDEPNAKQKV